MSTHSCHCNVCKQKKKAWPLNQPTAVTAVNVALFIKCTCIILASCPANVKTFNSMSFADLIHMLNSI